MAPFRGRKVKDQGQNRSINAETEMRRIAEVTAKKAALLNLLLTILATIRGSLRELRLFVDRPTPRRSFSLCLFVSRITPKLLKQCSHKIR